MSSLLRVFLAALILVGSNSPAFAWEVLEDWRDPIGGRSYTAAGTTNDAGMSVTIFRTGDARVRAVYSLPDSSFDRLTDKGRVLSVRPGGHKVSDIQASFTGGGLDDFSSSDGRNVRSLLWHGEDPSPLHGTLRNILDSKMLYARFFTDTGGTIDTSWSLKAAPETIAAVLGISIEADPEAVEWSTLATQLRISSSRRCGSDQDCNARMSVCRLMLQSVEDVDIFNQCVEDMAP